MKKITGKVVSLVLALALVVTSFSANFAFASTKKTMSGTVSDTHNDDIYLVNGGNKEVKLTDWLIDTVDFRLETKEHDDVSNVKVKAVSHVSGDKLVTATVKDDVATLKLKSSTASGKEVVSVLYEGDYSDDDNDFTVKGTATLNVYVYDKDQIVFGEYKSAEDIVKDSGKGLDDVKTFAKNKNSTAKVGIYKAEPSADSALATYAPVRLTNKKDGIADATFDVKNPDLYYFEMTSGTNDIHSTIIDNKDVTVPSSVLDVTIGKKDKDGNITADASTGNVTINVKKLVAEDKSTGKYKASTDSDDKYTLKTKVEKKIDVKTIAGAGSYSIKKQDGKTKLIGVTGDAIDVSDCEIIFPEGTGTVTVDENTHIKKISGSVTKLDIGDGTVGEVGLDAGNVSVDDGKVGNISTDCPTGKTTGSVTVTDGTVGNINTSDAKANGDITINGGTVGTIECDDAASVTVHSNDGDTAITTGKITAETVEIFADEAKVAVAGIKSSNDGTITLKGELLTVNAFDFDYRDTTLKLGDDDDAFIGKLSALANAKNAKIETENEDTDVTVAGAVNVDTISLGSDSIVTFDNTVTVDTIDGDGAMKIFAGKLYVSNSASSAKLKLSDATLAPGATVFKADKDAVGVDDLSTFGFTLEKSSGTDVDTFKIKSLSFAGIAINKTATKIAKGYSETFTASAYPGGTALPAGVTVKWELDGGSSDVFKMTATGNTAKVEVASIDGSFASENKTTLTATLYDEDGYELDDYEVAKCDVTALATPEAISDTTHDFSVAQGATYQFKITSTTAPVVTYGTAGVFAGVLASHTGNDYFYKITATGKVGAQTGIYLNGTKLLVASVKAPAFTSDTKHDITVKGSYTFKITAAATPTFGVGTAGTFKAEFVKKVGNDYFYKITSVGAAGAKAGIYVNGAKLLAATIG